MLINEPPNSTSAEHSVISSLIKNNDNFDKIPFLVHEAFYSFQNQTIFRAIKAMLSHRRVVDIVTLLEFLDNKKRLEDAGGMQYIVDIVHNNPSTSNIEQHAKIVMDKYVLRQLLAKASEINDLIYSDTDIKDKVNAAQKLIMSISESYMTDEPVFVRDLVEGRIDVYEKRMNGEIRAIPTGLTDLDHKLGGGVENGDLVIVAARPSMGKTALAVQFAENIQKDDESCIVFTCEMPKEQIADRVISGAGRVNNYHIKTGKFNEDDWDKLAVAIGKIQNMNMMVDDTSYDFETIASKCRTIKRKYGLNCVVVDYIGLLDGVGDSREQKISYLSRSFKRLAKELQIPIFLLSQLNRNLETRTDKRPVMSDLRESGAIEQDADIILFIYRDEVYNKDSSDKGTAELIIAKHRSGETGRVRVSYIGENTRFEDFYGGQYFDESKPKNSFDDF